MMCMRPRHFRRHPGRGLMALTMVSLAMTMPFVWILKDMAESLRVLAEKR